MKSLNKTLFVFSLLILVQYFLTNMYGINWEIISVFTYPVYILGIVFFILPRYFQKKLSLLQIFLSIIICMWLPWLAIIWIALWALNKTPPYIFLIWSVLYLILYSLSWFFPLLKINKNNYLKIFWLVLLNIILSIGLFYVLMGLFHEYFII